METIRAGERIFIGELTYVNGDELYAVRHLREVRRAVVYTARDTFERGDLVSLNERHLTASGIVPD